MKISYKRKQLNRNFPNHIVVGRKELYTNLSEEKMQQMSDFMIAMVGDDLLKSDAFEVMKFKPSSKYVGRLKINNFDIKLGSSFVFKILVLEKISYRLQKFRISQNELFSTWEAQKRGIPTPSVYGLYLLRDKFGLIKQSGIIMEDLLEFDTIQNLICKVSDSEREILLETLSEVIKTLYYAGCHHIDLNLGAIMVNKSNYSNFRIIDFQHAQFFEVPCGESFLFTISYVAKHLYPFWEDTKNLTPIHCWIERMIKSCLATSDVNYINRRIRFYNLHELRCKQRVKIGRIGYFRRIVKTYL